MTRKYHPSNKRNLQTYVYNRNYFILALDQGGLLTVESASLPVATFAKFQPHSVDFLDLTNPKAVLESKLRNFACLSTGDVIAITYNNKVCIYFNTACKTFLHRI